MGYILSFISAGNVIQLMYRILECYIFLILGIDCSYH